MTTLYKVKGLYGKWTVLDMVMSQETLDEYRSHKAVRIDSVEPYTPNILYVTADDCERCKVDEYVPHYNCLYHGRNVVGHSASHCTADACY